MMIRNVMAMALCAMMACLAAGAEEAPKAAVVRDAASTADVVPIKAALTTAGYEVTVVELDALCDANAIAGFDCLLLRDASALPADAIAPLKAYVEAGGDLIACNAPMWRTMLAKDGSNWIPQDLAMERLASRIVSTPIVQFGKDDLTAWPRNVDVQANPMTRTVESLEDVDALRIDVEKLTSWETISSPKLTNPFPDGDTLTVLKVRGTEFTDSLSVEWEERDGSRWIAVIPLTLQWRTIVLTPESFRYWQSVPSRAQTTFNPANASIVKVGLALSHQQIGGGPHRYWLGAMGSAASSPETRIFTNSADVPKWDTLCPAYKTYDITTPATLSSAFNPAGASKFPPMLMPTGSLRASHPRPGAGGFMKGRTWRFQPLLEAVDGEAPLGWRGAPATLVVNADGPYKGSVWASFAVSDPKWYVSEAFTTLLTSTARDMVRGVYLVDGGMDRYTYLEGQDAKIGATMVNVSKVERIIDLAAKPIGSSVKSHIAWHLALGPGQVSQEASTLPANEWQTGDGSYKSVVTLSDDNGVFDAAEHEAYVWKPKKEKHYLTVANGDFQLDGKRWIANGVNYMPSTGIATEDNGYFENWLGARSYDPVYIDRDLQRVKDMGLNSVSIFCYHDAIEPQNLLDILRRLDLMGLKANVSLRPGTPMDFKWDMMSALIKRNQLWEHDCVIAYDLAWEPMFPGQEGRREYDGEWEAWVLERYGSVANAEKDWEYAIPRGADGKVTNPPASCLGADGEWTRMACAYRRFLDTLVYDRYSKARDLVRTLDPNHAVSFRMAEAGNPTFIWGEIVPYDFGYLAGAVDVLEPEGYGRMGDWDKVRDGRGVFELARWAAPDKPMFWAEAGMHTWAENVMANTPKLLDRQGKFIADFYRMITESGADGVFWWWYPGGYRTGERSDYGILNADGTDRPSTTVIREKGRAFLASPGSRPVDTWLEIRRGVHALGVAGSYSEVVDAFWSAIEAGKTPGFRTAGTGTTSADCPLIAVGGQPCSGTNPPMYLDAFLKGVKAVTPDGAEVHIAKDGVISAAPGAGVTLVFNLVNLGEAAWVSPEEAAVGGVTLTNGVDGAPVTTRVDRFGQCELRFPLTMPSVETPMTFRLEAIDRTPFGPVRQFILRPTAGK